MSEIIILTKRCPRCERVLPVGRFNHNRSMRDGLAGWCKDCKRETARPLTDAQKERARARARARMARLRREAPEKVKAAKRAHYERNREKIAERGRVYRLANREARNASSHAYHERIKASDPERERAWQRVKAQRRRARAPKGVVTAADVARILHDQDGRCAYCPADITTKYEIEHVVPLSRGGEHSLDNIVLACKSCNTSKGTKTVEEWRAVA